jgi:hypothetical protein
VAPNWRPVMAVLPPVKWNLEGKLGLSRAIIFWSQWSKCGKAVTYSKAVARWCMCTTW